MRLCGTKCITTTQPIHTHASFRMLSNDVPTDRSITILQLEPPNRYPFVFVLSKATCTRRVSKREKQNNRQLHIFWILWLFSFLLLRINKMQITSNPHEISLASLLFQSLWVQCAHHTRIHNTHSLTYRSITFHSCLCSFF